MEGSIDCLYLFKPGQSCIECLASAPRVSREEAGLQSEGPICQWNSVRLIFLRLQALASAFVAI